MILLPLGCILCGVIAAANLVLRQLPFLHSLVYKMLPYKVLIGGMSAAASVLALLFPFQGPVLFGSFFPGIMGLMLGTLLSLEYFSDKNFIDKNAMIWLGNFLMYFKYTLGLAAILFGLMHFFVSPLIFL